MITKSSIKRALISIFYFGWKINNPKVQGYTVILPAPMDMPFLTYYALKGLSGVDLSNCHEILVVPDGCGNDGSRGLADAIELAGLERVKLLQVTKRNSAIISIFGDSGIAHWMTIVEAINKSKTEWLFLHDADAFFTDNRLVEDNYAFSLSNDLDCLGVTSRWDKYFASKDMNLPGTWELLFRKSWAKNSSPISHKAGDRYVDKQKVFFDTMLYPMFNDYSKGRISVKENHSFIHLSATVITYRRWLDYSKHAVGDELFRLLFLRLLKDIAPSMTDEFRLPPIEKLYEGLHDSESSIHYGFPNAASGYRKFRIFVDDLLRIDLFSEKSDEVNILLKPFDDKFLDAPDSINNGEGEMRAHGLYLGNIEGCAT